MAADPPDDGLPYESDDGSEKGFLPPPRRRPAMRQCLYCGQEFPSRDVGDRYCRRCRGEDPQPRGKPR